MLTSARTAMALAVAVLLFGGCLGERGDVTAGFATQRQVWQSNNAKNYSFVSSHSCFCTPNFALPLRVTVVNNAVASIVVDASGQAVPLNYRPTIDGLFDFIDEEERSRPALLDVTYHATLGYPTRIKYGTPENDGGGIISVTSLTLTP